jgi:hypothetical protein
MAISAMTETSTLTSSEISRERYVSETITSPLLFAEVAETALHEPVQQVREHPGQVDDDQPAEDASHQGTVEMRDEKLVEENEDKDQQVADAEKVQALAVLLIVPWRRNGSAISSAGVKTPAAGC